MVCVLLGIECVGIAEAAQLDTGIMVGQPVAALMGGMGRQYDGGYAEYTLVPAENVIPITNTSNLPVGATPGSRYSNSISWKQY